MQVNKATDLRPNLSINGPAINEPIGKHIVTKEATGKKNNVHGLIARKFICLSK